MCSGHERVRTMLVCHVRIKGTVGTIRIGGQGAARNLGDACDEAGHGWAVGGSWSAQDGAHGWAAGGSWRARKTVCVCVCMCVERGAAGHLLSSSLPPPAAGPCGRLPSCVVYVRFGLRRGCHGECAVGVQAGAAGSLLPPSLLPNTRMWRSRVRPAQCRVRSRACASVSLLLTPYPHHAFGRGGWGEDYG